jgi:hypothetical protein
MARTVHFDNDARCVACEIDDEWTYRSLPPETEASEAVRFDIAPHQCLGARHRAPKVFRAGPLLL